MNKEKSDFLLAMYQEHTTHGRHHETQRAGATNLIIVVSGGILAFIANKGITKDTWPLAAFLFILGLFGALFSAKHYERYCYHRAHMRKYREHLESCIGHGLGNIRTEAKEESKRNIRAESLKHVENKLRTRAAAKPPVRNLWPRLLGCCGFLVVRCFRSVLHGYRATIAKIPLHFFWIALNIIIAVLGFYLLHKSWTTAPTSTTTVTVSSPTTITTTVQ
jgi:hypothetical protein